jgi:hypothetical protein
MLAKASQSLPPYPSDAAKVSPWIGACCFGFGSDDLLFDSLFFETGAWAGDPVVPEGLDPAFPLWVKAGETGSAIARVRGAPLVTRYRVWARGSGYRKLSQPCHPFDTAVLTRTAVG